MPNYLKPQSPQSPLYHKASDTYFYPLTTSDQVLVGDKKLCDYNIISVKEIPFILQESKWDLNNDVYSQHINVKDLNETYNVDVKLTFTENLDTDLLIAENAPFINYAIQDDDTITFYCLEDKPNIDIPIEVEVGL